MNIELKGKRALVCGSTQGIGKAVALQLAACGASITLAARNEDNLKLVINELKCTRDILASDYVEETKLPQAVHHMDRVIEIFKLMSQQWRVMETLEPQDFLNFRESPIQLRVK